jgi:DNA polymerase III epsilon subunit-like protein
MSASSFQSADGNSYVVFDLETTGLSPGADEIIQIAGVRLRGGVVDRKDSFSTYVNPGIRIPSFITNYTGIATDDVRSAPRPVEALMHFSRFVGSSTMIAHNGHAFDMRFVRACCEKHNLQTREVHYFDSMHLSWRLWGRKRGMGHNLDSVMQRLALTAAGHQRHDARGDVAILALAVLEMWRRACGDFSLTPVPLYKSVLPIKLDA